MEKRGEDMEKSDLFDVFTYETHYVNGLSVLKEDGNMVYMSETEGEYVKQVIPPDPETVAIQTSYFADTLTVSGEGRFLKGWDIKIGVWKKYNRNGEVIDEVAHDEHYPIGWQEMRGCFLANGIRITDIRLLRRVQEQTTGRYGWFLTLRSEPGTLDTAFFDAETGDLIVRKQTAIEVI
ncbi:MAG: hypothetical protein IKM99_04540 [Bacteroidales bacterium]|nr:hypothetical protein [Bacteroidales bacterium]